MRMTLPTAERLFGHCANPELAPSWGRFPKFHKTALFGGTRLVVRASTLPPFVAGTSNTRARRLAET